MDSAQDAYDTSAAIAAATMLPFERETLAGSGRHYLRSFAWLEYDVHNHM
jgi:hypothetical protein